MNLYGIHDQEGAHLVPQGGWCVALVALSENAAGVNYAALRSDINWLVRVNWGYGTTGTIPLASRWPHYLNALENFVQNSSGITGIIIGNEPNHPQEWPDNKLITVSDYVSLYKQAHTTIKSLAPALQIAPAAIAPYRFDDGLRWNDYLHAILSQVECDFVAVHAYLRSMDASEVYDQNLKMGEPLAGQYAGFLTYEDAMSSIPNDKKYLPVHITETNPVDGWEDRNSGVVKAIYKEINGWNRTSAGPFIESVSLYRYPKYDKWGFADKNGVIEDFKEAVALGYTSPTKERFKMNLPAVKVEIPAFQREIDHRTAERGVSVEEVRIGKAWRVKKIQWFDQSEAPRIGPDHHFLFDTLDENGNRVTGVSIVVTWPTGAQRITSEAKPGEMFSANFPLSPSRNEFSAAVVDALPSERVRGVGMGQDTPSGYNPGIHTSTFVVFQRCDVGPEAPKPVSKPEKSPVPQLFMPIQNPKNPLISQHFGENPDEYKRFAVDGVSLKGHNGLDFAVPTGTFVYAADSGHVVDVAEDASGYGKYVKLVHNWGESLYAHLLQQNVKLGDYLDRGKMLGLSGNTGNSTGPHLHFGIRVNPYNRQDGWGGYVNPEPYLPKSDWVPSRDSVIGAIEKAANRFGVDRELLLSLAWAESSLNPLVNSHGLFQIGDAVWQDYAAEVGASNRLDAKDNAAVASAYLKFLLEHYNGDVWKALYAFNMGYPSLDAGVEVPALTKTYANKVIHGRDLLKAVEE